MNEVYLYAPRAVHAPDHVSATWIYCVFSNRYRAEKASVEPTSGLNLPVELTSLSLQVELASLISQVELQAFELTSGPCRIG